MRFVLKGALVALTVAALAGTTLAQEDTSTEDRIRELEEKTRELQQLLEDHARVIEELRRAQRPPSSRESSEDPTPRIDEPRPEQLLAPPRESGGGIEATFEDGLNLRSRDGDFDAHIGGRLLAHYRAVFDRPGGPRTSPDSFFVRQARLEMSGRLFRDYEFKVQADFPTGSAGSTTGTLQDGYLGWRRFPWIALRIGQFKEPFSQEETTGTRFIDFDERSVLNRLAPGRDIGIMLHGKLFDGILAYETGIFNGEGRAVMDGNDEKDLALRVRVSPFARSDHEVLRGLRLGIAGTIGEVDDAGTNGLDLRTTELGVRFLDATAGSIDGRRTRLGAELSYLYGPFSLRAEWVRRTDEVDVGTRMNTDIALDAWYVAATYLLTGETKPLEGRIVPDAPFDPAGGDWGAFELAVRIASLSVEDRIFDLGAASPTTNSDGVLAFTFGINWYPARNFRISPNLVFERYSDDVDFGGRREDSATGVLVRFQMDF